MILYILIINCFFYLIISQNMSSNMVTTNYNPQIIELGKNLNFTCIFNDIKFFNFTNIPANWSINNKIVFSNNSRFNEMFIKNKLIFQIKNVTENDLNNTYICNYNNSYGYISIFINQQTFIKKPKNNTYSIKYNPKSIVINFNMIYPKPQCYLKIDDYINSFVENFFKKINKFNYKTTLYLYLNSKKYCGTNFMILCTLIDKQFELNVKKGPECKFEIDIVLFIIFSLICCIIITIILLIIYLCKRHYINKKNKKNKKFRYY